MIKKLLIVAIFFLTIGSSAAANPDNMGNKYLVSDFSMSGSSFSSAITNQNDGAVGDFYWEITTSPAANHNPENVKQKGTFTDVGLGTFPFDGTLEFTPEYGTTYYLLIFTDYPEHDNRVSKVKCVISDDDPEENV